MKGRLIVGSILVLVVTLFALSSKAGTPCLKNDDCPRAYYCEDTPTGRECIPIPNFGMYCHHGGMGAIECSIEAGVEIIGVGIATGCSVKCENHYYACCSLRCVCILQR